MSTARPGVGMALPGIAERPAAWARVAGALYLFIIAAGLFAEAFVRQSLIVSGDPAATVGRIAASPGLWAAGAAAEFAIVPCALIQAVIEYRLLKPVQRDLALMAFAVNLVSIALEAANKIPLILIGKLVAGNAVGASVVPLVELVLRAHGVGFDVSLLVFGVVCLLLGYLIFHAGFLPRWLGVAMGLAGIGYLVGSGSALFVPSLARVVLPGILVLPFVGELSLCLWLLVRGVDTVAWRARSAG